MSSSGLSPEDLWKQIRAVDKLNSRLNGTRVLKSAEVDILVDGSLDYSDELLRELTIPFVRSIHGSASASSNRLNAFCAPWILQALNDRTLFGPEIESLDKIVGSTLGRIVSRFCSCIGVPATVRTKLVGRSCLPRC
jgi:histidinol phosphatase-like PHP family hydrolase